jgi:hypothetical protein
MSMPYDAISCKPGLRESARGVQGAKDYPYLSTRIVRDQIRTDRCLVMAAVGPVSLLAEARGAGERQILGVVACRHVTLSRRPQLRNF